jgi:hypothetical protein
MNEREINECLLHRHYHACSVPVGSKRLAEESLDDCRSNLNDQVHFFGGDIVRRRQQNVVAFYAVCGAGTRVDADVERGAHACGGC